MGNKSKILHPFGAVDSVALTAGGAQAVTISNQLTFIDGITTRQTAATTLNLTIGAGVKKGALIYLSRECNHATAGNRAFTFGTGITADVHTPADEKEVHRSFIYDGTNFVPMGALYVEA